MMKKNYMTINPDGDCVYFETKEEAKRALLKDINDWIYDECYFDENDFQVLEVLCKAKLIPFEGYTESEYDLVRVEIEDLRDEEENQ